mgnify:CR=1 FL=1
MARAYLVVISTQHIVVEHGENGCYYLSTWKPVKGFLPARVLSRRKRITREDAQTYVNAADYDCSNGSDRLFSIDDGLVAALRSPPMQHDEHVATRILAQLEKFPAINWATDAERDILARLIRQGKVRGEFIEGDYQSFWRFTLTPR